jgi:hypothetical protein
MASYFEALLEVWQTKHHGLPMAPFDEDAEGFIYSGAIDEGGWARWRPVEKMVEHDLSDIEEELGVTLHDSIKSYFNSFWFCSLGGKFRDYALQLVPVKPGIELDSFSRNLRGYKLAHEDKLENIPIGFETTQSLLLVVDNSTGEVKLEDSESVSFQPIADSLETVILGMAKGLRG